MVSSAEADNGITTGGGSLIQTGITYEYNLPESGCNLGNGSPALYYFVEVVSSGVASCFNQGLTGWSAAHLQTVVRNTDG